jgi:hypothetical protein
MCKSVFILFNVNDLFLKKIPLESDLKRKQIHLLVAVHGSLQQDI